VKWDAYFGEGKSSRGGVKDEAYAKALQVGILVISGQNQLRNCNFRKGHDDQAS
jgi:hypothetical protein